MTLYKYSMYSIHMSRKIMFSIAIICLSIISILFLYLFPNYLILFLLALAYIKHKIFPIKKELAIFSLIVFSSAVVEIILVNMTHAWSYTNAQLFDIPFWPPIFWGLLGTSLITFYEGISKN